MLHTLPHCASGVDFPALLRLLKEGDALLLLGMALPSRLKVTASLKVCAMPHNGLCLERRH